MMSIARFASLLLALFMAGPAPSRAAPPPTWPASLTIGTAAPGGTYVVYGQALAKILTEALEVPVTTLSTQGPDQNIVLMESGQAMLGFVTMGPALQAWNGTGEWTRGKKYRAMRALFPMYDTPFQLLVGKDAGIRSIADLMGKRIGTGPRGGTAGTYYPAIFKALNITLAIRNGAWSEIGAQLQKNQLDALGCALGVPFPFVVGLEKQMQLETIDFSAEQLAVLRREMPELSQSAIPAGTYAFMKTDYQTIGLYNFAVANKDLPDDLVYAIVKATFANRESLIAVHSSAKETLAANVARNGFLPFHPGAVRYYREIGVTIPDNLAGKD